MFFFRGTITCFVRRFLRRLVHRLCRPRIVRYCRFVIVGFVIVVFVVVVYVIVVFVTVVFVAVDTIRSHRLVDARRDRFYPGYVHTAQ